MAERQEMQKKYAYSEMSNKVQQADRSGARRNRGEPTGEVNTLSGRTDIGRMGDRVAAGAVAAVADTKAPKKVSKRKTAAAADGALKRKKTLAVAGETILDLSNLAGYQPTTEQAAAAYEGILTVIGSRALLGNQGPAIIKDAAEEVISTLKDDSLRDPERHEQISRLLTGKAAKAAGGGVSTEQFTALVQMGKQLNDYHNKDEEKEDDQGGAEEVDEMGVAVVFDESDEDKEGGDSDADEDMVQDSSSSEDEGDEAAAAAGQVLADESSDEDMNADEEKVVQGTSSDAKKKSSHKAGRVLSVHEIDAHYLQRLLSSHFDDADAAAGKANEILEILDIRGQSADMRECENRLLVLLGFDLFDTIKLVLHNRVRVWACVSMKRAQSDEQRNGIEQALNEEATGEGKRVWDELHSKGRAEDWTRERIKGITASMKAEDSEDVSKALDSIGIKGAKQEDDVVMDVVKDEPASELDLEALAFQDGAHTMSNKKCNLPDTSWRAMKKGYEEVHVPAVRSVIPEGEKLVSIKDLPPWTQSAFPGTYDQRYLFYRAPSIQTLSLTIFILFVLCRHGQTESRTVKVVRRCSAIVREYSIVCSDGCG
jgi:pre-mRNA-splicing helicase BRR2